MKELIKKLQKYGPNQEVIVDGDLNGYYTVENVGTYLKMNDDEETELVNIISSNEA